MKLKKSDNPLFDELVSQPECFLDFKNLHDQLLKLSIDSLLKAEMNHHLGCNNIENPMVIIYESDIL